MAKTNCKTILTATLLMLEMIIFAGDFKIISARYGNGNAWADVTEKARNCVIPGMAAEIPANNAISGKDPAPGKIKKLIVKYKLDGETKTLEASEGKNVIVFFENFKPSGKFKILKASYGGGDKRLEVTEEVRKAVLNGKNLKVSNSAFKKDPAPGRSKNLAIIYSVNNKIYLLIKEEGNSLEPEDFISLKKNLKSKSNSKKTGPLPEGFVTKWLISGPYPSCQVDGRGQAFNTDFLKGEADFVPYSGMKAQAEFIADWGKLVAGIGSTNEWGFRETKNFDATWKLHDKPTLRKTYNGPAQVMVFDKMFDPIDDYFCVYAICWIESPEKRKINIGVGSDDDHKIYLNGKLVGKHYGAQATLLDDFKYTAELKPGLNRLMFKLVDRTGGADFCLRITDKNKKAMNDLKFYTDHPGRKYGAELYQNGYAGNLKFETGDLFSGEQKVNVEIFTDKPSNYMLKLNGKPVKNGPATVSLKNGKNILNLEVIENGKPVAVLQKEVNAYSKKTLEKENHVLREKIIANEKLQEELKETHQKLSADLKEVLAKRKEIYKNLEAKYAEQRAKACLDGKKSIDELMTPATVRSRLCINGEWEASIDHENWSKFLLPAKMHNEFFDTWYHPLQKVKGKTVPCKGWENYKIHPVVHAKKAWFRRNFSADGKSAVTLVCKGIKGKLQVYVNGKKCGDYAGWMGQCEFPLKKVKKGNNVLELCFETDRRAYHYKLCSGIVGDLYLDFTSPVKMSDVWVKTSWRNASISLTSEIENRTDKEENVEIRQYAVRDGRIKLRLPASNLNLAPNRTTSFKISEKWADPLIWGIGGKYGNPDMYDLVSDVYVDGKLTDRYVQPFGFREFWIHATDFFLNGKRIILQGDVGHCRIDIPKLREVVWNLLRNDGINIIRYHDTLAQWCQEAANMGDRMGMLSYVQMYPVIFPGNVKEKQDKFSPFAEWKKTPEHQYNLDNYRRWHRLFRNNPSVVIWSTDNEIFTQAWNTAARREFNIRNDKVGAIYEKFMKTLDPDLTLTRDGDVGTWSHRAPWFEDPPCDTANYHYPDFNINKRALNWQHVYDYRPTIFGETLYCAAWNNNPRGAYPHVISKRAKQVKEVVGLYRDMEVPGQIFMGLSLDGFIIYDDSGKGNPWGITKSMHEKFKEDGTIPSMMKADQYPNFRIQWPAYSGKGRKIPSARIDSCLYGNLMINWFDPSNPSHIRNMVNDAYKETLLPQAPLKVSDEGECIILTEPNTVVWSIAIDGTRYGVQADKNGKAWFQLPVSGKYTFKSNNKEKNFYVPSRASYALKPGFNNIKTFKLK